jgi:hypothetical protein
MFVKADITSKFSSIPLTEVTHLDSAQNKVEKNQRQHSMLSPKSENLDVRV